VIRIEIASDMDVVRVLVREYGASLGIDLSFQNFDLELATLPGDYLVILVAYCDDQIAGCVALRELEPGFCEMKRLYVRPLFRGRGAGRALAKRIIDEGRARGYARMRLDTLPQMQEAIPLYRSLGFVEIGPYRFNPIEGTKFMELSLDTMPP
jgi:ribosomal protein S18 acetylase RimI-like enzyme